MKHLHTFAIITAIFATGCAGADPGAADEDMGSAADAIVVGNGADPAFFWMASTQRSLRSLATSALAGSDGNLAATPLATTSAGRSLLRYVVGCALPAGTSVYSATAGMSFSGAVGLSPGWRSAPLDDTSTQRWMTGCLLQSLNGLGLHVNVRLAGDNPALDDASGADTASYTVPDATMFGNLFQAGAGVAYACTDVSLLGSCGVQISLSTLERICGFSLTCGITLLGPCARWCKAGDGGDTCTAPTGTVYPEAVSSTLKADVAISLYPLCLL